MANTAYSNEQKEHMKELADIPREKRCKCGWYIKNACPHCNPDQPGKDGEE